MGFAEIKTKGFEIDDCIPQPTSSVLHVAECLTTKNVVCHTGWVTPGVSTLFQHDQNKLHLFALLHLNRSQMLLGLIHEHAVPPCLKSSCYDDDALWIQYNSGNIQFTGRLQWRTSQWENMDTLKIWRGRLGAWLGDFMIPSRRPSLSDLLHFHFLEGP